MQQVWQYAPDCTLVIAGADPADQALLGVVPRAADGRVDPRVELPGYVSRNDLLNLYHIAWALLLPLIDDAQTRARFPTKVGEYLASGRPVVTSEVSANTSLSEERRERVRLSAWRRDVDRGCHPRHARERGRGGPCWRRGPSLGGEGVPLHRSRNGSARLPGTLCRPCWRSAIGPACHQRTHPRGLIALSLALARIPFRGYADMSSCVRRNVSVSELLPSGSHAAIASFSVRSWPSPMLPQAPPSAHGLAGDARRRGASPKLC